LGGLRERITSFKFQASLVYIAKSYLKEKGRKEEGRKEGRKERRKGRWEDVKKRKEKTLSTKGRENK
jgi:hypothetical protein